MKATSTRRLVGDPALGWSQGLRVEVGGGGTVSQAGVVLPRLLADRLGLTTGLAEVVARAEFFPVRHRGRALVDAPARLVTHARRRILKIPPGWEWSNDLVTAWDRLQALHPA